MSTSSLSQLLQAGQSFWYDNIQRSMLSNGDLQKMIDNDNLRGITSNPSIFEKAISSSNDYDKSLQHALDNTNSSESLDPRSAFYDLAIEDIQTAADLLRPVYDSSNAQDGYVSLEVSPDLAHDTEASIKEGQALFLRINRPNAMIKIPATKAGIPVIEKLIEDGINVNATLLFSVERYTEVANAYIRGINHRQKRGLPVDKIASVASFFISRVDSALDVKLDKIGREVSQLRGQLAVSNAYVAYNKFNNLFNGDNFATAKSSGAMVQRLLWASTGVKDPNYSDVRYIEELIFDKTVNTIPPATAVAFNDHGSCQLLDPTKKLEQSEAFLKEASKLGIDLGSAMETLEIDGLAIFEKSFFNLLKTIEDKLKHLGESTSHVA